MKLTRHKILLLTAVILSAALNLFAQTEREKGIEFYESGNYKAAIESLKSVIETDKTDGVTWRFLGMAFAKTGNMEEARKSFDKADNIDVTKIDDIYDTNLNIISPGFPKYTKKARKNKISGVVRLTVEFGGDGKIGYIFPVTQLADGLTENAIQAARQIKFEPALRNKQPVTAIKMINFKFEVY